MARGDGGKTVFENKDDCEVFLHRLGEACGSCGWRVHAWVLMGTFTFETGSHPLTITSSGGATTGLYTLVTSVGAMTGPLPTATLPVGWTADDPQIVGHDLVLNITSTGSGASPYELRFALSMGGQ